MISPRPKKKESQLPWLAKVFARAGYVGPQGIDDFLDVFEIWMEEEAKVIGKSSARRSAIKAAFQIFYERRQQEVLWFLGVLIAIFIAIIF